MPDLPPIAKVSLGLCRPPTRWLTARLAPRCPPWISAENIAAAGLAFSLAAALALYLASFHRAWLWPAALLLLVRSIADCLDGEVARLRGLASDHGMFLDIFLDDLAFTAIFLGLACASYANFAIILVGALVYLLNDVVVNLRIHFIRRHDIPIISPVEICVLMAMACALTYFFPGAHFTLFGHALGWFDGLALVANTYGTIELLVSARSLYITLKQAGR